MRFIANGPSIPSELLSAREQDRVVFFCGAGVSKARAHFVNFSELTKSVIEDLGVLENSAVQALMNESEDLYERSNKKFSISSDRIFGLLEQDFYKTDIYESVAKQLIPTEDVDLGIHETILKLATTQDGVVRLVTTNFDRLFDKTAPTLPTFLPYKLPSLSQPNEFNGIVYLHGKINESGTGAENNNLVLSSSEFGEAYLAKGWATHFIKEILKKYIVVFVGYSADDPPMQYLLEALSKDSSILNPLFAFQEGDENKASAKWRHKGVTAIPCNNYDVMWETLRLWAQKAENSSQWYQNILNKAKGGPALLEPFERGQVAHIVSYSEGAQKIQNLEFLLPASWLYVFDDKLRLKKENFHKYCIDADPTPQRIHARPFEKTWNAFAISSYDFAQVQENHIGTFWSGGSFKGQNANLLPRQQLLLEWLCKVMDQPEAIQWAIQQGTLSQLVREQLMYTIRMQLKDTTPVVCEAWYYILNSFEEEERRDHHYWFNLQQDIKRTGWTEQVLRTFATYSKPYIKISKPYTSGRRLDLQNILLKDLLHCEVTYPDLPQARLLRDDTCLCHVVRLVRQNLEKAVELKKEFNSYGIRLSFSFCSQKGELKKYMNLLEKWISFYTENLVRLATIDTKAAQKELYFWIDDTSIFAKLRTWALGQEALVPTENFQNVFNAIPPETFWSGYCQRDLLIFIESRWRGLDFICQNTIKERIIKGPIQGQNELEENFKKRKAFEILNRMQWLESKGCISEEDWKIEKEKLQEDAPEWTSEHTQCVTDSFGDQEPRRATNDDYSCLMDIPVNQILSTARKNTRQTGSFWGDETLFLRLSSEKPSRAFLALKEDLKNDELQVWAWEDFLCSSMRKEDEAVLIRLILTSLRRVTYKKLVNIIHPICTWLENISKIFSTSDHSLFIILAEKLIETIEKHPTDCTSPVLSEGEAMDWVSLSINSPVGHVIDALLNASQKKYGYAFAEEYMPLLERLCNLPENLGCFAINILASHLSTLYSQNADWTKKNVLSALSSDKKEYIETFWSGAVWNSGFQDEALFSTIKPHMFAFILSEDLEKLGYLEQLVHFVFYGWLPGRNTAKEHWVSDKELRRLLVEKNDMFRNQVLILMRDKEISLYQRFFSTVWPKHIIARTPKASEGLCEVVLESGSHFPEIVPLILRFLTKLEQYSTVLFEKESIAREYPNEMLSLLEVILPDNARLWPYNTSKIVEAIKEQRPDLVLDRRLITLQRRLDSRG